MKLGIETSSVVNHMMANNTTTPVVGEGATILQWSDRSAYTVRSVSKNGKTVVIERCDAIRTDKNGMSECQEYDYTNHTGQMVTLKFYRGNWCRIAESYEFTDAYFDAIEGLSWEDRKEFDKVCVDENSFAIAHPVYTRLKITRSKVNILWGERNEYRDFSF